LRLAEKYRLSWYEPLVVAAALDGKCGKLYSQDFQQGRKIEELRIENPYLLMRRVSISGFRQPNDRQHLASC
jgi:predicted nucleic acid-binding protein